MENQGLNTTTPTEVVEPYMSVIVTMSPIVTDSPSSERGKSESCEGILPDYYVPVFQDMLKVYGENAAIKVTAEYLSGSFVQFSQFFARTYKRTGGLFRRHRRPLRDLFQFDACSNV